MHLLNQFFSRRRRYNELSESIREHLDEKIADMVDRGMTPDEAERTARCEFGNVTRIEERSREVWQWPTLESIWADVKFPTAQTDIARTKAGGTANGVNTAIVQSSTQGGFGSPTGDDGGVGFSAGTGSIVTSTLGAGTARSLLRSFLTFQGYVDHTVTQEANPFLAGAPILKTNTIEGLANFSQSFPLGTNIFAQYLGQRIASEFDV